jgi:hypothetical protein
MRIVYICERPYNLYRTLLKAVNSDDEMDLVISNNIIGMELMCEELRKSGLFRNVFYFNDLKHKTFSHTINEQAPFAVKSFADFKRVSVSVFYMIAGLFDYFASQRRSRKITLPDGLDFDVYDEIHITDCTSMLNFYVYRKKYNNIVYVEHSKNGIKGTPSILGHFLYVLVKLRLIYGIRGSCRYISAVEVNDGVGLTWEAKGKEIREVPIAKLLDDASLDKREFIYQIYAKSYSLDFPKDSVIDVFLTTYLIDELETSVRLCEEVVRQHMSDAEHIVIKPHPSAKADYSGIPSIFPNAVVLPSSFSAEVFALSSSLRIRKLINIDTSSLDAFKSVEEILTLGHDFVESVRRGDSE